MGSDAMTAREAHGSEPKVGVAGVVHTTPSAFADYSVLTKPRITTLVAVAAFVGGLLAAGPTADLWRVAEAALWIALSSAAACVFNQVAERDVDRLMVR